MTNHYSFTPFTTRSLDLVARWLSTPDVAKWYEDPDYIEELEDQLANRHIEMQLVCLNKTPFAFVQNYAVDAFPGHHLSYLPKGAHGIDTFIGEPAMLGRGHGPAYLKELLERLKLTGTPALGIDPHPRNIRAIKAYGKLGFKNDGEFQSEWGPVLRMSLIFPA